MGTHSIYLILYDALDLYNAYNMHNVLIAYKVYRCFNITRWRCSKLVCETLVIRTEHITQYKNVRACSHAACKTPWCGLSWWQWQKFGGPALCSIFECQRSQAYGCKSVIKLTFVTITRDRVCRLWLYTDLEEPYVRLISLSIQLRPVSPIFLRS